MKTYAPVTNANNGFIKVAALLQLGVALFRVVVERGNWSSISMTIVGGLVMLFSAKEAVNDERIEHLKLKAAKTGLLSGTVVLMLIYLVSLPWADAFLRRSRSLPPEVMPLSAFDSLILVMVITLSCYYYWRWQDGRTTEKSA